MSRLGEATCEPSEARVAQLAALLPRNERIEKNQADRTFVDDVLNKAVPRHVGVVCEGHSKIFPMVVISGNRIGGNGERIQDRSQVGVLLWRRELHEVTASDYQLRSGVELG